MGRMWFFPFNEAHFSAYLLQGASSLRMSWVMQTANVAGATALAIDVTPGDRPADLRTFVQSIGQPASTTLQWEGCK